MAERERARERESERERERESERESQRDRETESRPYYSAARSPRLPKEHILSVENKCLDSKISFTW